MGFGLCYPMAFDVSRSFHAQILDIATHTATISTQGKAMKTEMRNKGLRL